jgi:hypothetical protein
MIQQVTALLIHEPLAADGHRGHLAPAGRECLVHQVVGRVLAGPGEQARAERELADLERLISRRVCRLSAADQGDNLHAVAIGQRSAGLLVPAHHLFVDLNGEPLRVAVELPEQVGYGQRR